MKKDFVKDFIAKFVQYLTGLYAKNINYISQ